MLSSTDWGRGGEPVENIWCVCVWKTEVVMMLTVWSDWSYTENWRVSVSIVRGDIDTDCDQFSPGHSHDTIMLLTITVSYNHSIHSHLLISFSALPHKSLHSGSAQWTTDFLSFSPPKPSEEISTDATVPIFQFLIAWKTIISAKKSQVSKEDSKSSKYKS